MRGAGWWGEVRAWAGVGGGRREGRLLAKATDFNKYKTFKYAYLSIVF